MTDVNVNIGSGDYQLVVNSLVKGILKINKVNICNTDSAAANISLYCKLELPVPDATKYYFVKDVQLQPGEAFAGTDLLIKPGYGFYILGDQDCTVSANW